MSVKTPMIVAVTALALCLGCAWGGEATKAPNKAEQCVALKYLANPPAYIEVVGLYAGDGLKNDVEFIRSGPDFISRRFSRNLEWATGTGSHAAVPYKYDVTTLGYAVVREDARSASRNDDDMGIPKATHDAQWAPVLGLKGCYLGEIDVSGLTIIPRRFRYASDSVPTAIAFGRLDDLGRLKAIEWRPHIVKGAGSTNQYALIEYDYTDTPNFSPGLPSGWTRTLYSDGQPYESASTKLSRFIVAESPRADACDPRGIPNVVSYYRFQDDGAYAARDGAWHKLPTQQEMESLAE